jgi:hypothetical protein
MHIYEDENDKKKLKSLVEKNSFNAYKLYFMKK